MSYNPSCEPLRVWNRLEPRTRQPDFSRVLRAEVYDGLWLLARQWQFGEFHGEDTGSAVFARLALRSAPLDAVRGAHGGFTPYADQLPIETQIERTPAPDDWGSRIQLGRQWLRTLDHYGHAFNAGGGSPAYDAAAWRSLFLDRFALRAPEITGDDPAAVLARARFDGNPRLRQQLAAAGGRLVDGLALLAALPAGSIVWSALPASLHNGVDNAHRELLVEALRALRAFHAAHCSTPEAADVPAWQDSQLEYRFAAGVPRPGGGRLLLDADEYHGGHIDWYSFDLGAEVGGADAPATAAAISERVFTVIPSPAEFPGQPRARYWEFEDGAVDLGTLRADSTDLARILVTEFALVYGNNWFVIPCPQAVGTLAEIQGIVVDDVFGERTLVQSATGKAPRDWTRWEMFSLGGQPDAGAVTLGAHLLIPPAVPHIADAAPQASVRLLRDELANTVWAIEARVPDGLGGSHDGLDHARRVAAALQRAEPPIVPTVELAGAELRYRLATSVPENWIPFLPVHQPGEDRAIRLQRASMPRFFQDTVSPVRPLTRILRAGLLPDDTQAAPYFIHEEEVPRAGVRVDTGFRRARWYDGATFVWYAHNKRSGRGEGNSGLRFDTLEDIKPRQA